MQATKREARSLDVYQWIAGRNMSPQIRNFGFKRDIIIGLIGDRGSGKSIGAGQMAIRDYMMRAEPCYANMFISATMPVEEWLIKSEEYANSANPKASEYLKTLQPGYARYQAQPLDITNLLQLSDDYMDGVIVIDEINIALADARRSMSNQNLGADDLGQQLRKLRSALIYTCISELFVDLRIRDMTDFFISCKDIAFTTDGLDCKEGEYFKWRIFPMTDKAAAIAGTYKPYRKGDEYMERTVNGKLFWGCINTWQRQRREKHAVNFEAREEDMSAIEKNPFTEEMLKQWGWLYRNENFKKILLSGEEIERYEMMDKIGIPKDLSEKEVQDYIENEFQPRKSWSGGKKTYLFRERELVLPESI